MLNEQEKQTIQDLKKTIEFYNKKPEKIISVTVDNFDVDTLNIVLNLITKLQKENEEKDKQIDLMAKYIDNNNYVDSEECQFQWDFKIEECIKKGDCKDCIKNYYEKLAKEKE